MRDILLGEDELRRRYRRRGRCDRASRTRDGGRASAAAVRVHDRFGTAIVFYDGGERIDVVTARRESYASPGALPSVEHAALRDDLHRRDFTVNAMAASLASGRLRAAVRSRSAGRADLAAGTLRVLHEGSFVDDPTRIFRGIRYENRYGFAMDPRDDGARARLRRARPRRRAFARAAPRRARAPARRGRDDRPLARASPRARPRRRDPAGARGRRGDRADRSTAAARSQTSSGSTFPSGGSASPRSPVASSPARSARGSCRLKIRRRDAELIAGAVAICATAPGSGPRRGTRRRPISSRSPIPPRPTGRCSRSPSPSSPPLRRYFTELRHVRSELTGADLAELGLAESPRVGEVLAELRRRKLDGELHGRDGELAVSSRADRRAMSDPVETVRRGYDVIADAYLAWNDVDDFPGSQRVCPALPRGAARGLGRARSRLWRRHPGHAGARRPLSRHRCRRLRPPAGARAVARAGRDVSCRAICAPSASPMRRSTV